MKKPSSLKDILITELIDTPKPGLVRNVKVAKDIEEEPESLTKSILNEIITSFIWIITYQFTI